jgi:hypothetical protein
MTKARLTPFDMVFAEMAEDRFPAITSAFTDGDPGAEDRDTFLMNGEALSLIHELRPDESMGPDVDHLAALVHLSYLHWKHGGWVFRIGREGTNRILQAPHRHPGAPGLPAYYLQLPQGLFWGQLGESEPHQPLDGCFLSWGAENHIRALGVFGLHQDRMGFGVVDTEGPLDQAGTLETTPAPFTPAMDGGQEAGLYSVNHPEDLIRLAGLSSSLVAQAYTGAAATGLHEVEIG